MTLPSMNHAQRAGVLTLARLFGLRLATYHSPRPQPHIHLLRKTRAAPYPLPTGVEDQAVARLLAANARSLLDMKAACVHAMQLVPVSAVARTKRAQRAEKEMKLAVKKAEAKQAAAAALEAAQAPAAPSAPPAPTLQAARWYIQRHGGAAPPAAAS